VRQVCYHVAASLDGFIADPNGGFDWIPHDSAVDFGAIFARFDTILMGRKTFEVVERAGGPPFGREMRVYVFSTTLPDIARPNITIVRSDAGAVVEGLRRERGDRDIWLFGGGLLFAHLLTAGQVDTVEITVVPVLLGAGLPLVASGIPRTPLRLLDTHRYPSGMVTLRYAVERSTG